MCLFFDGFAHARKRCMQSYLVTDLKMEDILNPGEWGTCIIVWCLPSIQSQVENKHYFRTHVWS